MQILSFSQILFGIASEDVSDLLASALDMLTTQRFVDESTTTPSASTEDLTNNNGDRSNLAAEMFMTERILWNLLKCSFRDINSTYMPSKDAFTEYLKTIRRAQAFFKYKVNDLTKFLRPDLDAVEDRCLSKESRQVTRKRHNLTRNCNPEKNVFNPKPEKTQKKVFLTQNCNPSQSRCSKCYPCCICCLLCVDRSC